MPATVVVGAQWGDEGKGKIVDLLTPFAEVVVRYAGGANAGHTLVVRGEKIVLHLVPSGILHAGQECIVGQGCVVDAGTLLEEIDLVRSTKLLKLGEPVKASAKPDSGLKRRGYVSTLDDDGEFRAVETAMDLDRKGRLVLPRAVFDVLAGEVGMEAGYTPIAIEGSAPTTSAVSKRKGAAGRKR